MCDTGSSQPTDNVFSFYFLFIHAFSIPLTDYVCLYVHRSDDVDCGNTYQGLKANGKTLFLLDAAPRARRVSHSTFVWCQISNIIISQPSACFISASLLCNCTQCLCAKIGHTYTVYTPCDIGIIISFISFGGKLIFSASFQFSLAKLAYNVQQPCGAFQTPSFASVHITLKIPVLVRSLKSSNVERGQYLDG